MKHFVFLFALLGLVFPAMAAKLVIGDPAALFPQPDTPCQLKISLPADTDYVIRDITGEKLSDGKTIAGENGFSSVEFNLPRGWYKISFPDSGKQCGIAVTPDVSGKNKYWCIDAGLTWSGWKPDHKKGVICALQKKGIASFRERMAWHAADNGKQFRDGQEAALRRLLYDKNVLELYQHMPNAFLRSGSPSPFDCHLDRLAAGAKRMEERLNFAWDTVEAWNEPFFFGKALPADQYVPVAKALSAAYNTPMAGGCFAPSIPHTYLKQCLDSGFADIVDVFTLHIYSSPESMLDTMDYFRKNLSQSGNVNIPIWLSETGTPGTDKYPNCNVIAMRAIECLSLGAERFYAFYLQFHQEGAIRWGMTDKNGTPEFALAAYLTAAEIIADKEFKGTVPLKENVSLSRVFTGKDADVLVIFGKNGKKVELPAAPLKLLGADGRTLPAAQKFINKDGLSYAVYAPGTLKKFTQSNIPNMKLYRMRGKAYKRQKPQIIIQLPYPKGQVTSHSNNGYVISPDKAQNFRAAVRLYNFSNAPADGTLTLTLPDGKSESKSVNIPANGNSETAFTADFRAVLEKEGSCTLKYDFKSATGNDRITQIFCRPPSSFQKLIPFVDAKNVIYPATSAVTNTTVKRDLPGKYAVPENEFSSTAKLAWSNDGLHFQVTVKDKKHETAPDAASSWQYDSLQIAVNQYNSAVDHNRFEWGFYLGRDNKAHAVTFHSSTKKDLSKDSKIRIVRNEEKKTTVYNGLIAWNDLGSMNAIYDRNGLRMKFTFCVNDHNGAQRRWSEWTPGIAQDKNPAFFAELVLTDNARRTTAVDIAQGVYSGDQNHCIRSGNTVKLLDKPRSRLEFKVDPVKLDTPVTLRFSLAPANWYLHKGIGFSFTVSLLDSVTREAFVCYLAPSKTYAGKSGYMLLEKDAPGPLIGTAGKVFSADGKFRTVEFTIDNAARKQMLYITVNGKKECVVSGPIRKNSIRSFDKIIFTPSGWGAGPFQLKDIALVQ